MKKTPSTNTEPQKNGFWSGLCLGVFCSLFLATVLVYTYLSVGGFRIQLDQDRPALFMRDQIKAEAFSEFNLLLEKLKLELPAALKRAFQAPESLFIPYEDGAVSLPREIGVVAREKFQQLAVEAVLEFLQRVDLTPYVEEIGQEALAKARQVLNQEVAGKTYYFDAHPLLAIPVQVATE
ncbi:MAG TPA: hypothetical protein GXX33_04485 [Firmicutes bacterium]|uniref:Uncharacterized protein n=1 Tax=Capillibacterium thermochitinicola TaxID=2699427 RepID=A0A8J6I139_9FIRM|nr:hypothetical protein [Capillibacterium thermochitinicola]MBA2133333.1 hypothetical protein [Capillibacterium thermochitinicola]HHW12241.1 hypothetical protein [Bacillota bacterium]